MDDSTTTCHGAAVSEALTGPERLLALGVVLANLALIVGLTMRADFSNLQGNGAGPGTPPAEVVPADAPTTDPALFAHGGTPGAR